MLAAELRAAGMRDDQVTVIPDEEAAIEATLRMAAPGDLLLVFCDAITRTWKQVVRHRPHDTGTGAVAIPAPVVAALEPEYIGHDTDNVIRGERGVRFAREIDD